METQRHFSQLHQLSLLCMSNLRNGNDYLYITDSNLYTIVSAKAKVQWALGE